MQLIMTALASASSSELKAIKTSAEAILAKKQAAKAIAGGNHAGFDWTQCKSEVCCPFPYPLLHAVSCDFLDGCVCFHP